MLRVLRVAGFVFVACISELTIAASDIRSDAETSQNADRPAPFVARAERSEADEDRLQATVLFTYGRLLSQRQDYAGALRSFQRAHRRDANSTTILKELVSVALELGRGELATRYAVRLAERDPQDPSMLIRLAGYLASEREYRRAIKLLERAVVILNPPTPLSVMAQLEIGRLHFLLLEFGDSHCAFEKFAEALEWPDRYQLNDEQRQALVENPQQLYALLGEAALRAEQPDAAEKYFVRANEAQKNIPLLAYQLARIDVQRKDWNSAVDRIGEYCKADLSQAGTEAYGLLETAIAALESDPIRRRQKLNQMLSEYQQRFPTNVALSYYLAESYRKGHELDLAEGLLQGLRERQATAEVYVSLCELYWERGDFDRVLATLSDFQAAAGVLDPLSETATRIVHDHAQFQRILAAAASQDGSVSVSLVIGQLLLHAKRFDEADNWFRKALEQAGAERLNVLSLWGLSNLKADQPARAIAPLRQILDEKLQPEVNSTILNYLTMALLMSDEQSQALEVVEQQLQADPSSLRLQVRRAWVLSRGSQREAAERAYRTILKQFDGEQSLEVQKELRDCRLALSNLAVSQQKIAVAEEWLEQVLDEFPDDPSALNDLGYLWADQGKFLRRALRMVEAAVARDPENRSYRDSLGWALFRLGRYQQALNELLKAVDQDHPDGVVLDHLGDCFEKSSNKEQARVHWQRAAELLQSGSDRERLESIQAKLAR